MSDPSFHDLTGHLKLSCKAPHIKKTLWGVISFGRAVTSTTIIVAWHPKDGRAILTLDSPFSTFWTLSAWVYSPIINIEVIDMLKAKTRHGPHAALDHMQAVQFGQEPLVDARQSV